jgi:hypothetical protein
MARPFLRRSLAVLAAAALSSSFAATAFAQPSPAGADTSAKGRLVVKEASGKPVRVFVDNIDMGDAPWSGDVDAGSHDVVVRGGGLAAAPQKVTVEGGKTQEVTLSASSSSAPVKIGTSDGKGLIYLDDKLVGEGSFVSDIPAGVHRLRITREGYDPFEEEITVKDKEPFARTVTLKISSKIETGVAAEVDRLEGLYGGFNFAGLFTPGGMKSDVQKLCENKPVDVSNCDAPDGFGGGFGAFIGYHWDPVGIELYAAGQYDARTMKVDWAPSTTDPGVGPNPPRHEEYKLYRVGGMGIARARLTLQNAHIRGTFALGVGIVRRAIFFTRDTTSPDGKISDFKYVSDSAGYWSPIVSFEPAISYRLSRGVAVSAGLQLFFESPSTFMSGNPKNENPRSSAESGHRLGDSGPPLFVPRGLVTNAMDLASNLQIFIGPFIGMMFGP